MNKIILPVALGFILSVLDLYSQNVAINSDGSLADSGTMLDVKSSGTTTTTFGLKVKDGDGSDQMVVRSDGNVGIGTNSPNYSLSVQGSITAGTRGNDHNASAIEKIHVAGVNGQPVMVALSNSNVRTMQLATGGGGHCISWGNPTDFTFRSNSYWVSGDPSTAGNELMRITNGGSVGIGTPSPDQLLSVNGSASKVGGGSWSTFSDERLKKDILPFKEGLEVVKRIKPVHFKYNGLAGYPDDGRGYVGVIAQDIQKIAPYMVGTVTKKMKESDKEPTDLLMYDGSALIYILVNAIKDQQKIIDDLKSELETQKKRSEIRFTLLEEYLKNPSK